MAVRRLWLPKLRHPKDLGFEILEWQRALRLTPIGAALLRTRLSALPEAERFLKASEEKIKVPPLTDGELVALFNLLWRCKLRGYRVVIYGDYDVDGVTSSAILYKALREMGIDVHVVLPNRFREGYGLNLKAIERIVQLEPYLVIAVDNGITAADVVSVLKDMGLRVAVIDHHHLDPSRLPDADAIIHPEVSELKGEELTAGGISLKVALALMEAFQVELPEDELIVLAAISTIADVAPLTDENRVITLKGLQLLSQGTMPLGLRALWEATGRRGYPRSLFDVAFIIAPRLNAVGRLRDPSVAFQLLVTTDERLAERIASYVEHLNRKRRELQDETLRRIENEGINLEGNVIVTPPDRYHEGVIGIVAHRLAEVYGLPAFVSAIALDGYVKGSARSPHPDVPIIDALHRAKTWLSGYGGHRRAGGFSLPLDNFKGFERALREHFSELSSRTLTEEYDMNLPVDWERFIPQFVTSDMWAMRPFGEGNPLPKLGIRARVISVSPNRIRIYLKGIEREVELRVGRSSELHRSISKVRALGEYLLVVKLEPSEELRGEVLFLQEVDRERLNLERSKLILNIYTLNSGNELTTHLKVRELSLMSKEEKLGVISSWDGPLLFKDITQVLTTFKYIGLYAHPREYHVVLAESVEKELDDFDVRFWHEEAISLNLAGKEPLVCAPVSSEILGRLLRLVETEKVSTLVSLSYLRRETEARDNFSAS